MAESDEPDDHRLAGRTPRTRAAARPDDRTAVDADADDPGDDTPDDQDIDAVTRLMGFLRSTD